MTPYVGPALSIRIDIGRTTQIEVRDGRDTVCCENDFKWEHLKSIHMQLRKDLDGFRAALGAVRQTNASHVSTQLKKLQRRGRLIVLELFRNKHDELVKVVEMCNRACPGWRLGGSPDALAPSLVTVRAPLDCGIPVELLPLLELETPPGVSSDPRRIAASFLSFSAILKRDIGVAPPSTMRLSANPRLPIKAFLYRGLPGVEQAHHFLRSHELIDLDDVWPGPDTAPEGDEFAAELARHLWEPDKGVRGTVRAPPNQICFFACHCDTTAEYHGERTLTLHTGKGWLNGKRSVDLDSLNDKLAALRRTEGVGPHSRPLVFLNACGSCVVDPAGAGSFPDLFLKRDLGFLGFIGTQATIPDAFAAEFAKAFYQHILEHVPIGRALHAARWDLLSRKGNPLGILYSLYAEPEITLRRTDGATEVAPRIRAP